MTFEITHDTEKNIILSTTKGDYDFEVIKIMSFQIYDLLSKSEFKCKVVIDHSETSLKEVSNEIIEGITNFTKQLENYKTVQIAIVVNKLLDAYLVSCWKSNSCRYLHSQIDIFFSLEEAYEWIEI